MKIVIVLFYDPLLKRDVCELHQVKSEDLAACLVQLKSLAVYNKKIGSESKHRFIVVDKMIAFI